MNITKIIVNKTKNSAGSFRPLLLKLSKPKDQQLLKKLFKQNKIQHVVDNYSEQLKEYFEILNPKLVFEDNIEFHFKAYLKKLQKKAELAQQGKWVYYPWNATIVHILAEPAFFRVRTARNRNLITEDEQKKFYNCIVGIAGLSVGNSAALAIILQGGSKHIKLADHDSLELSNTNRIRTSISNLGLLKVEMTARQIYELNPYAKIEIFPEGLNEKNVGPFCKGLNVIVDEVDNLSIKYLLRVQAKKRKLPVVMAADNGDNGIVDVERYDQNRKLKFFHGRLGNINYQNLKSINKWETGKTIVKHIGIENVGQRTYESFLEMGKTLASWPQLGGAALLNGSIVSYCVRKIVNNQPLEASRSIISLDDKFTPGFNSITQKNKRKSTAKKFKKILGL